MGFALHRCCAAPNALGDPPAIAEDIVRNVVHGGRVEVRAVARYQQVPQIVTGQIRLFEGSLWATDYDAAEIDWNGLVVEGRKIVPAHLVVLDTSSADRTPRKQMARERAERAIKDLYPAGVPNQSTEPNSILWRKVGDWLKKNKLPDTSLDTILRAAGRRK